MPIAELIVRHTRRHLPTRRVALERSLLPCASPAAGPVLLQAVVATHGALLGDEELDDLGRLVAEARRGLSVPRIALRHRLQTDVHGLDRSVHRVVTGPLGPVVEVDVHGPPVPQVLGAVLAAARLSSVSRGAALGAVTAALAGRPVPGPYRVVLVDRSPDGVAPPTGPLRAGAVPRDPWAGVPARRRWAMEVLGLPADARVEVDEVNRRYRRLVRVAHPDHGGTRTGAAERLADLTEARAVLLAHAASVAAAAGE